MSRNDFFKKTALVFQLCLVLVAQIPQCVQSYRILVVMPTPAHSHNIVYRNLWLKLNERGHNITILTTKLFDDAPAVNFTQIDWSFAYNLWHSKHNYSEIVQAFNSASDLAGIVNYARTLNKMSELLNDVLDQELGHPDVRKLIMNPDQHFDLVITEIYYPPFLAFAERFKCPAIGISPMYVPGYMHEALGNPTTPSLYSETYMPYDNHMNFWERFSNTFFNTCLKLFQNIYSKNIDLVVRKHFPNFPSVMDFRNHLSMSFLNVNPLLHDVRPMMPNSLHIGGGLQIHEPNPLPEDIQRFLDSASQVVYLSFGSMLKSSHLSREYKSMFAETFQELPYHFLMKFDDASLAANNSRVMIKPWLPQQDVLRHPNVKLFIMQSGPQSYEEALYNAVPMIGIPVFVDQFCIARRAVRMGIGLRLKHNAFSKEDFKYSITEIINNANYSKKALGISKLIRKLPNSGLDRMVWWTEYVLRHKGADILRKSPTLYQNIQLDIVVFVTFCCLLSMYLFYTIIKR